MPLVSTTLSNIEQSVIRPTVLDIVKQVKEWTQIHKDTPIFIKNSDGQLINPGTTIDEYGDRDMRSESLRRLVVTINEKIAEDQQVTDIMGRKGNIPVLFDDKLDFWMAPISDSTAIDLELEFTTRSKEEARRWVDDVSIRYRQGRYTLDHHVKFGYTLPFAAWRLFREIWQKREANAGYGETLEEYLAGCSTNRLVPISNETGTVTQMAVAEHQHQIQGFFNFTNDVSKAEHSVENGTWTVRFTYSFVFQKPIGLDMHYPIAIHQQLISEDFVSQEGIRPEVDDYAHLRTQWQWGHKPMEKHELMRIMKPRTPYIRLPYFDTFSTSYCFPGTAAYAVVLTLHQGGDRHAFNLKEMTDIEIDPDILDFLKTEYVHIGKPGKSVFHFDVYRGGSLCSLPGVEVTADLDVNIVQPIDERKTYHVRCAVYTDMSMVDREAIDRIMAHPKAFTKWLAAVNELLRYDSSFQKMGDQRRIEPWQFSYLYEAVMGQSIGNIYTGRKRGYGMSAHGTSLAQMDRTFISDIPKNVLQAYRNARKTRADSQVFGIACFKQ